MDPATPLNPPHQAGEFLRARRRPRPRREHQGPRLRDRQGDAGQHHRCPAGSQLSSFTPDYGAPKTFLAHALGNAACRRQYSVLAYRCDRLLKHLRHARLDGSYDAELRKILSVDVLILDDFGLDAMDATESRDAYEIFTERHRHGSIVVTSNRGPDEWLALFADPVRAQAAIDRFTTNAYDLVIEGESYRSRQKPSLTRPPKTGPRSRTRA